MALTLTVGLSACDVLDLEPKDRVTQFDYFKTANDLELFSNPFYNNLLDKEPFDEQSDLLVQNTLSAILFGGSHRTVPESGGGWSWTDLRRMNTLLEYADMCEDKEAVTKYTAVTRFFRAFFYFEKVKRFGDVPWYDIQLGSADELLYKPRDSRELILTKMLEDIDYAINSGGLTESAADPYHVNKWAALALKAQFCLYEGTYRKYHNLNLDGHDANFYLDLAAKAALEIIEKGPYKLYQTGHPEKDYLTHFFAQKDASPEEYILAIKFDYAIGARHNASAYTLLPTQGRPGLTRKFINTYLMDNGTAFTDKPGWQEMQFIEETDGRDPRLAQSIRTPGYTRIGARRVQGPDVGVTITGYQPVKFVQDPTSSGGQIDRNDRWTCDMPVFRYGEVLLIYAEAKAELGSLSPDDLNITVNEIRSRVGMPALTMRDLDKQPDWYLSSEEYGYPNVTGSNEIVNAILEIRRERTVELIQEGFRLQDLYRWKAGYCIDQAISGMYFPGPGEYNLAGKETADLILRQGQTKPQAGEGVSVYELGSDIILSEGAQRAMSALAKPEIRALRSTRNAITSTRFPAASVRSTPNLTQNPGLERRTRFLRRIIT